MGVGLFVADRREVAKVMADFLVEQLDDRAGTEFPPELYERFIDEHIIVLENLESKGYRVCKPIREELS